MAPPASRTSAAVRAGLIRDLTGPEDRTAHPPSVTLPGGGGKFSPRGETLLYPGNTFLCRIDRTSALFAGLVAYQAGVGRSRFAGHFACLDPTSFHMTVLGGISGAPGGALAEVTARFARAVADWRGARGFTVACDGLRSPMTIALAPASDRDRDAFRDARRRLQEITGIRREDVDTCRFHVSLAYQIAWMTPDEAPEFATLCLELYHRHLDGVGPTRLGAIELCRFETMQRFERVARLG